MTDGPRETMLRRLRAYRAKQFQKAVTGALYEAADKVRAEASRSITAGSVSGKKHVPSAPGQPPSNDTGTLRSNIEISQPTRDSARVTSFAPYSGVHEFGSSRHPQRPFMRPARDKVAPLARTLLILKIRKAMRKF
ncbi:MAG: HK97 gp10 family phage protein [Alphaproteobacteria bacterium]|jgi:HK97 gp10 family phage protein|nr:HK97 gp10 family phage protein [Alphaproteobacteria bacterium]MBU1606874.1 HK97 gp10 family phage protein [Alphaproteobacteria bacterium]